MALDTTEPAPTTATSSKVIATASRTAKTWHATTWPTPLDRHGSITALMLAERVITHGEDDPRTKEWRRELARG